MEWLIILLLLMIWCDMPEKEYTIQDAEYAIRDWEEEHRVKPWWEEYVTWGAYAAAFIMVVNLFTR